MLTRRRRLAVANVARAFPGVPPSAQRRLAHASFQHAGLMAVELCRALVEPPDRTLARVSVEGLHHLTCVMERHGRGLLLTAHLGNWELLTLAHRLTGFPLAIVVRRLDATWVEALVRRLRAGASVAVVDKRHAVRPVLQALRRGCMVAILLDQNATRREGVFVPFFGYPASTSRSIATFAIRTSTPVVPLFIQRQPDGRHRITIEPALVAGAGSPVEEAIIGLTRDCTLAIEQAIRRAPEQWLWMHARWRTRPAPEGEPAASGDEDGG